MRLIKKLNILQDAQSLSPDIQKSLLAWCQVVKQADWNSLDDIRKTYDRSVDKVGKFLVFNIKSYRLIVICNFKAKIIYYRHLLSHQDYEKGKWKL